MAPEFERQVVPHLDAAYNLARWLVRKPAVADDVVQEAMLRALRYHARLRSDAKPWLPQIVRNVALTRWRRGAHQPKNLPYWRMTAEWPTRRTIRRRPWDASRRWTAWTTGWPPYRQNCGIAWC